MKKITLAIAFSLVLSSNLFSDETKKVSLSNDEIDLIFMSYEQQAREEAKKEKEEAKQAIELEKQMLARSIPKYKGSREVLPHNGNRKVGDTKTMPMLPPEIIVDPFSKEGGFRVSGIVCDNTKCEAFTTKGTFTKGMKLSDDEKIVNITKTEIKTNVRTISL